jgi:hypothetical protein
MVTVCEEQLMSPTLKPRQNPSYAPVTSHVASRLTLADVMKNGEAGLDDSLGTYISFRTPKRLFVMPKSNIINKKHLCLSLIFQTNFL